MLIRIISSIVGILILITALLCPSYVFAFALIIVVLIGLGEFFSIMKVNSMFLRLMGFLIAIIFMLFYDSANIFSFTLYILLLASFLFVIFMNSKKGLQDIYITLVGTLFVSFLMSHILKVRELENGSLLIWLIFIGAWITDTGAYIFGITFGRHKLSPISPKKSIEGSIAGMLCCIIATLGFGYYLQVKYNISYPLYHFALIGLICGMISQVGDLSASLLKRSVNAKDFGNIMPGHGGILDRFDSILFTAPAVYYYLYFILNNRVY